MIRSAGRELKRRLLDPSLGPTFRARDLESFFFKKIIVIYSLLAVLGFHRHEGVFSRCGERGLLSSYGAQAPCSGFSLEGLPGSRAPARWSWSAGSLAPRHAGSSCNSSVWSPALAGGQILSLRTTRKGWKPSFRLRSPMTEAHRGPVPLVGVTLRKGELGSLSRAV